MASYIIRKLDELPWPEIKARAALDQKTIDQIVKDLLRLYNRVGFEVLEGRAAAKGAKVNGEA